MRISLKIFSKKVIFCFLGLILISAIAGFFYYWQIYKTPPEKWAEAKYSPAENYKITEENGEKFIENKKAGISFKVPNGWRIEKPQGRDYVALYSANAEGSSLVGKMESGCEIFIQNQKIKTDIKTIENELNKIHQNWEEPGSFEIVKIGRHDALKNTLGIPNLDLRGIGVYVPTQKPISNSVIYISLTSNSDEIDKCSEDFLNFLSTVSIE